MIKSSILSDLYLVFIGRSLWVDTTLTNPPRNRRTWIVIFQIVMKLYEVICRDGWIFINLFNFMISFTIVVENVSINLHI